MNSKDLLWKSIQAAEIPLSGGQLTPGIVRIGDTVRRPAKASSPFVAQLLDHLESQRVAFAPRYRGQDEYGRDVMTYMQGSVPQKWQRFSDQQLQRAAFLLRQFHDATRNSKLTENHQVICHHDPGPNNFVFDGDHPTALIDFDMAAPGEPIEDLGYMAWAWCISSRTDRQPATDQARQVRLLVDAYGLSATDRRLMVEAIPERQSRNILFWTAQLESAETIPTTRKKMLERIEWSRCERDYTIANRQKFSFALN